MKKIFVALMIVAGFSTQAHAWGDREQGALAGIAGTLIMQQIFRGQGVAVQPAGYPPVQVGGYPQPQYPQQPPVVQYPQPTPYPMPPVVIAAPTPYPMPTRVCDSFPQYDVYGRYYGQRTVCRHVH